MKEDVLNADHTRKKMSRSKQKGTLAETAIKDYLKISHFHAMRLPLQGARDEGDIYIFGMPVVIEVKNCAKMELSQWIKEAKVERDNAQAEIGVVWHKKRGTTNPGDWYVTMTGEEFVKLLEYWRD